MAIYPSTRPSVQSSAGRGSWAAGLWSLGSPGTSCSSCTKGTGRDDDRMSGVRRARAALYCPPPCCSPSTPSPTQQLTSTHPPRPSSLNQAPQASGIPAALAGRQALCASPRPHWRVHIPHRRDQARQLSGVHQRLLPCKDPNLTSTIALSGPF